MTEYAEIPTGGPEPGGFVVRAVVAGTLGMAGFTAGLFWAAGRIDWWPGWVYVALLAVAQGLSSLYLWRRDPELIRRRGRVGEGTPWWDALMLALFGLGYFSTVVVGALDSGRYGWSSAPLWTWPIGAVLCVAGVALATRAMAVNTHFEKTVRIQRDRAHRVVDGGPYRIVRHPGYVGAACSFPLAAPLLLGSWWAFLPAAVSVAALGIRTALEDRFLQRELPGYAEYCSRTRYRLVPGLW